MEKGDEFFAGPFEGDFVDESGTLVFGLGELAIDVVGGESDVMNARAFLLEEDGDWAIG